MLMKLITKYLRPYWPLLVCVLILQTIAAIASLTMPNIQATIINEGVSKGDTHLIWTRGGLMLGVSLIQITAQIIAGYCGVRAAMAMGRDIRDGLFDHVLSFSSREVNQFGAPSLITRNTNDVQQVQMLVMFLSIMLVSAPIMAVGGVIMALRQDVALSWIILAAVVIMGIIVGIVMSGMVPLFRLNQTRIDAMNRVLREQLTGVRVIRAFVTEVQESLRFARANADLRHVGIRIGTWFAVLMPIVMLIMNGSVVAVWWFGARRVDNGDMLVGNVTAFLTYLMLILMSVMMAAMMMMFLPRAQVCANRIQEVLNTAPSVVPPEHPV
ncbi:MAG: ABC transporter ATP-binding protein, partial [Actinomycetia bacterium]|nr:ABC transporter ATP-binding protein [Actinomycetes bacterium]